MSALLRLFELLLEAGTPLNEAASSSHGNVYPIDLLLLPNGAQSTLFNPFKAVMQAGADPTLSELSRYWDPTSLSQLSSFADEFNLDEFHAAVLARSLPRLKMAVKESPSTVKILLQNDQNGAHVASDWPAGLEFLIGAGVDIDLEDLSQDTPLTHALISGNEACVILILEADCALFSARKSLEDVLDSTSAADSGHKMETREKHVAVAIANRRKRLKDLALIYLPRDLCRKFKLYKDSIPDHRALPILESLEETGITIPTALCVQWPEGESGSIYHAIGHRRFSVEMADTLWELGFQDVHVANDRALFPINNIFSSVRYEDHGRTQASYIANQCRLLAWIFGKGEPYIYKWLKNGGIYTIATNLGSALQAVQCFETKGIPQTWLRCFPGALNALLLFLFEVPAGKSHEACQYFCSSGGCRPLDRLFQAMNHYGPAYEYQVDFLPVVRILDWLLATSPTVWLYLVPNLIRILLFRSLGMQHTCCQFVYGKIRFRDIDEAREFRNEHAESIDQFEALLPEVIEEFWASGLSLLRYLKGPFALRVEQILRDRDDADDEYTSSVFRNTGVRLERKVKEPEGKE